MTEFVTAIIVGETAPHDPHVAELKNFFQGISVQVTTNMGDLRDIIQHYAIHTQPQYPVLFIKDSSIIDCTPDYFHQELTKITKERRNLYYFGGYHDNCHQNIPIDDYWSLSNPMAGHQAVLYDPEFLRVIADNIKQDKRSHYQDIIGHSVKHAKSPTVAVRHPPLVHFDMRMARDVTDFERNNDCRHVKPMKNDQSALWWVVLIIVFIVALLVAVGIIWYRGLVPKTQYYYVNDPTIVSY